MRIFTQPFFCIGYHVSIVFDSAFHEGLALRLRLSLIRRPIRLDGGPVGDEPLASRVMSDHIVLEGWLFCMN